MISISIIHAQTEWTIEKSGTEGDLHCVVWTGENFVIGGAVILISPDGKNWELVDPGVKIGFLNLIKPGKDKDIFGIGSTGVFSSPKGLIWTEQTNSSFKKLWVSIWNGNLFIGGGYQTVMTSPDGINWTEKVSGAEAGFARDIAWSENLIVAVGGYGCLHTSPDGKEWETHSGLSLATVTWAKDKFVALMSTSLGDFVVSTDGITWEKPTQCSDEIITIKSNPATNNHSLKRDGPDGKIRWTGNEIIYVGSIRFGKGTYICTSPDGSTWTTRYDSTGFDLIDIAWNDEVFVAVGRQGTILTSPRDNTEASPIAIAEISSHNIILQATGVRLHAVIPSLLKNRDVSVSIYNISGKNVFNQKLVATNNRIECNIANLPSGRYNFVVNSGSLQFMKSFYVIN